MSTTKTRSRQPQKRSVKVLIRHEDGSPRAITLVVGKQVNDYWVRPVPSEIAVVFELEKFSSQRGIDEPQSYHVCLDGEHSTCECLGFLRWGLHGGRACKHIDSLQALVNAGKLDGGLDLAKEAALAGVEL